MEEARVTVCPKCLKPFAAGRGWTNWFGIVPLNAKCRHCGFAGGPLKIGKQEFREIVKKQRRARKKKNKN